MNHIVYPITSADSQKNYYEHLNHWRVCYDNENPLFNPTREEALEYLRLLSKRDSLYRNSDLESRKKQLQLESYDSKYDWRPRKSLDGRFVGLESPTGDQLLPNSFADVFTQFDAINHKPCIIPVSNGEAWGLATLSNTPILIKDFQYNAIIPERWERRLLFVQDKKTMKWGALLIQNPLVKINGKYSFGELERLMTLMPPVADEIYEDELMTEDAPVTFFMTRKGIKLEY